MTAKYLQRINAYDCRGPCLTSIPILNPDVLDEAAASDARRAAGKVLGPLDGIPYTLKDSMMYKGMTCATGAPALEHLVANQDSFVAEQLRKAGAVCVGRTNTPPMMASGMHRGVYGRAESPYNLDYLTAAFSSGSSNGAATSTAASFAAFGLGSETVSSGRSPASNNGLVAYTPSRTVISPRGVWPLYPTCDVLVPMTRTVTDMLAILDCLAKEDVTTNGDFWREQKIVDVPPVPRPSSYLDLIPGAAGCLHGKRIAVPKMYIGGQDPQAKLSVTSPDVISLWQRARADLEAAGATVIETDFPLVTNYEDDSISGQANNVQGLSPDWYGKERGELVAYAWDDFLRDNNDPQLPSLAAVDGHRLFPRPKDYIPEQYSEMKNFMDYPAQVQRAVDRNGRSIWDIEGLHDALPALEAQRKRDLEDWMDAGGIDLVVFPANGDVGRADLDTNHESARFALQNGVRYSNGNRAIRHMGVPTLSVTMGMMGKAKMPVNLTFAGKHGQDSDLLRYAYAFEQISKRRFAPPVTPALPSDSIPLQKQPISPSPRGDHSVEFYTLSISKSTPTTLSIRGSIALSLEEDALSYSSEPVLEVQITVDNHSTTLTHPASISPNGSFSFETAFTPYEYPHKPLYGGRGLVVDNVMVLAVAVIREEAGEESTSDRMGDGRGEGEGRRANVLAITGRMLLVPQ